MSSASEIAKIHSYILQLLPEYPNKLSTSAIKERLGNNAPHDKALSRYLASLAEDPLSGVVCDKRERPYQWGYKKGNHTGIHNPTQAQAITLQLAKQTLWDLFPKPMQKELEPLFDASEKVIRNSNAKLMKKICVISPSQPLISPSFKHNIREAIGDAIYEDIAFEGQYRNTEDIIKSYTFHPLAILQRGFITYLIARVNGYEDPRFYAVHRFESIKLRREIKPNTKNFNLQDYLNSGAGGFIDKPQQIKLVINAGRELLFHLKETPLSTDQIIKKETATGTTIEATVMLTEQLIWWLLSWTYNAEVLSPKTLRNEMINRLSKAVQQYS
jgi:predicted DNA-binding transcriptional regulator YafY